MFDQDHPAVPPGSRPGRGADARLVIRTGTYLHPCCPLCGYDLVEDYGVHLEIIGPRGERGELRLSPRFNVFHKEATINLPIGTQIQDILCPHCNSSMVEPDRPCERCQSHAAKIRISVLHDDLALYICTRIGCHWHGLTEEDGQRVILDEPPEEEKGPQD
jgi:hypothetical protein